MRLGHIEHCSQRSAVDHQEHIYLINGICTRWAQYSIICNYCYFSCDHLLESEFLECYSYCIRSRFNTCLAKLSTTLVFLWTTSLVTTQFGDAIRCNWIGGTHIHCEKCNTRPSPSHFLSFVKYISRRSSTDCYANVSRWNKPTKYLCSHIKYVPENIKLKTNNKIYQIEVNKQNKEEKK